MAALYDLVLAGFGLLADLAILGLALGTTADVVLRNLGITTLPWLLEVSEYVIYAATFLAAPWVLNRSSHVRVDVFVSALPGAAGRWVNRAADLLGLGVCAVFTWYSARVALRAFERGELIFKELVVPEWWPLTVMPVAGVLLMVEFGRRLFGRAAPVPPGTEGV